MNAEGMDTPHGKHLQALVNCVHMLCIKDNDDLEGAGPMQ